MIACKEVASILMSDRLASQTWMRRVEIRLHLAMCKFCSRLARQLVQLGVRARLMADSEVVSSDFEDRLIHRLSNR
jgi:hypothetical protein